MALRTEFKALQAKIHDNAVAHGWWDEERDGLHVICLVHSELSEMCEAIRLDNPPSEKIAAFSQLEEEAADVVIRLMDFAEATGMDLIGAIEAKHEFNKGRPYKHGKEC